MPFREDRSFLWLRLRLYTLYFDSTPGAAAPQPQIVVGRRGLSWKGKLPLSR
jgi:hypothetical protein